MALLLASLTFSQVWAQVSTKRALIIAAGHYSPGTGWGDTGAANDAVLVRASLLQQGFVNAQIRVLADTQATKAGIVAGLRALTAQAHTNDIVVFHFSGHGQQVADDNGDEADGFDEALVPTDAPSTYLKGRYEGQRHLRDDELGALLRELRQKLGPQGEVLVLLDACYSGTGTRGLGRARGSAEPLAPVGYAAGTETTGKSESSFGLTGATPALATLAPIISLAGSSPHEMNFETIDDQGNAVGPLSLAFAQTLNSFNTTPSYESLFDRIKAKMAASAPNQSPQLEGAAGTRLFGGSFRPLPAHYKPLRWLTDRQFVINGGTLHGLFEQSEVALYPPDAPPGRTKPLATGRLIATGLNTATVELDQGLTVASRLAWVYVTARSYGPLAVSLRITLPDQPQKQELVAALMQRPFVRVVTAGPADLTLESSPDPATVGYWQLTTALDQVAYRATAPPNFTTVGEVLDALSRAAQARYLRGLQAQAPDVRIALTLVPLAGPGESKPSASGSALTPPHYSAGQYCQLRVTNNGRRDAYFTVLDIQPDNYLHVLLPSARTEPADYFVATGRSRLLPDTIRLSPPYGTEMFKLISTPQPLDLRDLVGGKEHYQGRSLSNPFARLFALSYPDRLGARAVPPALPPAIVNTTELVFIISKP